MKKRKISSTIVIILAMCLAITGCSGQQIKPTTTEEQKITVQTQTQAEVEVTEAETEPTVETENPTLLKSDLLSSIYITKYLFAKDLPCLYTFLKSESFFKPWVLLKSILKPP